MANAEQNARKRAAEKEEGGRQISAQFPADEVALLEKVKDANPRLSQKELFIAGLEALAGSKITKAQALEYLERNLK